jgi:hypothetical protein
MGDHSIGFVLKPIERMPIHGCFPDIAVPGWRMRRDRTA